MTQYGATMSGSWDECEKRWRALSNFPIDETVEEEIIESPVIEPEPVEIHNEVEIIEIRPQTIVEPTPTPPVVELTASVIEIEGRSAEIDALCRDFLLVGSVNDDEDVFKLGESIVIVPAPIEITVTPIPILSLIHI